jgi:hypothetical protein
VNGFFRSPSLELPGGRQQRKNRYHPNWQFPPTLGKSLDLPSIFSFAALATLNVMHRGRCAAC